MVTLSRELVSWEIYSSASKLLSTRDFAVLIFPMLLAFIQSTIESRHRVPTQWLYSYLTPAPYILLLKYLKIKLKLYISEY